MFMSRAAGFLLQIFFVAGCLAQEPAEGNLSDYISLKISVLPSSEGNIYLDPTNGQKEAWKDAMNLVLESDLASANTIFNGLGYRIVEFLDTSTNSKYAVIERKSTSENHWGIYIISQNACRGNVVIQCPHPVFDTNTGLQGIFTFLELDAKALFVGGTHRCNSSSVSSCSGTTSACGINGPFRISDQAHNSDGVFQKMTEILIEANSNTVFIQMHGFGKQSGDPNAILSNGTRITPQKDYIGELIAEMKIDDPTLTFRIAHIDLSWDRLLAFTNTQGRLINGSIDPCRSGASDSQGNFIHIEQELAKFRSDETGWTRWIGPMSRVFECVKEEPLSEVKTNFARLIYPIPFKDYVAISTFENPELLLVYNTAGQLIIQLAPKNWNKVDLSALNDGTYFYQLLGEDKHLINSGRMVKH
ncbi:MAG: hypothetical protein ACI8TA_001835 [Cyclobacteriaceae bacterium]|jgi:hypothetical protein